MADAERITMPEYLAVSHYHNLANSDDADDLEAPQPSEVSEMFLRLERAGIAKVH